MPITPSSIGGSRWHLVHHMSRAAIIMKLVSALILASGLATPVAAQAAESNRFVGDEDTVSIVSMSNAASGLALRLGLLFRLSQGWHIYWKNAGDAGSPPQLSFTQPLHITTVAF